MTQPETQQYKLLTMNVMPEENRQCMNIVDGVFLLIFFPGNTFLDVK